MSLGTKIGKNKMQVLKWKKKNQNVRTKKMHNLFLWYVPTNILYSLN